MPGTQQCPAWSPDGTRIVFCSTQDTLDIGNHEIYVMNADGSGQVRLTTSPAGDQWPAWSPDGSQIAFVSTRDGGNYEIYVMDADGTNQTVLPDTYSSLYPAWSPDGTQIAVASYVFSESWGWEIWTMNADGTGQINRTNSPLHDFQPAWGPSVAYDFAGFFQPVDTLVWNNAKAGQAIPVKFSLGGDQGFDIFRDGFPKAIQTACPGAGAPVDAIETYAATAGGSALTYDTLSGQYNYVWKTDKAWVGKCFRFDLGLKDGSSRTFQVQFKK